VDLLFEWRSRSSKIERHVFVGRGDATFAAAHGPDAGCDRAASLIRHLPAAAVEDRDEDNSEPELKPDDELFTDVDGDGRAELIDVTEIEPEKDGMKASMKHAKRPPHRYRAYRMNDEFDVEADPFLEFRATGWAGDIDLEEESVGFFRDLDGDGRKDLVTVTLEFSILQAVRVLATKRISIGLNFHVWAQAADGSFREVPNLDLSEKLKFDLNNIRLGRLAQFAGDFDGDGRIDFVHLGRGREVSIHRGQPGCRYPVKPDLVIELDEELQDLLLVRVKDYDRDGRADLSITRLMPVERQDVTPPVALDLYLSGVDE
jgi:hypothetical protein